MAKLDAVTKKWICGPDDEHAVKAGCYFDLAAAERVREFFRRFVRLPPTQGELQRSIDAGRPAPESRPLELIKWQWNDVIGPLFGWKRPDGRRRFRRGYVSTAKKNGKTGLSGGIMLYMLLADGEPSSECYSVASDRQQASLVYGEAAKMLEASPALQRYAYLRESTKTIIGQGRSFYRATSSESRSKEGLNGHLILYDELHAARSRVLFDALRYAGAARRQPIYLTITTAGDGADAAHICREQYDYAKGVIAGDIHDIEFLAKIFEAPEGAELDDPKAWEAANPSIDETIDREDLATAAQEAKDSPAKEASFRRYRLNQWVSNADAWISDTIWDACPKDPKLADLRPLIGRSCYLGADLSSTDDLTALVAVFPPDEQDSQIRIVSRFFLPQDNIANLAQKHRVPYQAWAKSGHMKLTPGNVVDYDAVRDEAKAIAAVCPVLKLGLDRGYQGQSLELDLIDDGFDVVPVGAGWRSQSQPLKDIEKLVKARRLVTDGNPVMRWNALNTRVKVDDAGNYSLSKRLSRAKIDGIAALANAVHCFQNGEAESRTEQWDGSVEFF